MDLTAVNDYLARIRTAGDASLRPCGLITAAFRQSPPHNVGVAHLVLRPRMILGDPTGTGKTPTSLAAYAYLKEKHPTLKMLVLTTQAAQFQWVRNVEKFLRGVSAAAISYGRTKQGGFEQLGPAGRMQQWPVLMNTDIWVTTYSLALLHEHDTLMKALDKFVYIVDEAQDLKNHKGEVYYPAAQHLSQKAACAWALTATPMMNDRLEELYSIMELVRPGTFGDFSGFRKAYFDLTLIKMRIGGKTRRFYKRKGYKNIPLLQSQVEPFFLKRPVSAFAAYLPPVTFQQLDVPLDSKQRAIYKDIVAKRWPVSLTPLQQLAALTYAQMAVDAPTVIGFPKVPSAKTTELLRVLPEQFAGRKVIIYSKFKKVVNFLSEQLTKANETHTLITGSVTPVKRAQAQERFQTDPTCNRVLVTRAGSSAIDLQAAEVVICYDLPWSWGEFKQLIGRARRIGSVHANVLVLMLCGESTIDTAIAKRLTSKEEVIHNVLGSDTADALLKERTYVQTDAPALPLEAGEEADHIDVSDEVLRDLFASLKGA